MKAYSQIMTIAHTHRQIMMTIGRMWERMRPVSYASHVVAYKKMEDTNMFRQPTKTARGLKLRGGKSPCSSKPKNMKINGTAPIPTPAEAMSHTRLASALFLYLCRVGGVSISSRNELHMLRTLLSVASPGRRRSSAAQRRQSTSGSPWQTGA